MKSSRLPFIALLSVACSEYAFQKSSETISGRDTALDESRVELVPIDEVFEIPLEIAVNKIDVAFLLDTTGSMSSTASAVASEYSAIVSELDLTVADAAYGFATFDDYNFGSMGSGLDLPFILQQQVTTDEFRVQAALNAVTIHSGDDGPESCMEGLYQGLTGAGYDQTSNLAYDFGTDVLPYISDSSDAFGGTSASTHDAATPGGGSIGGYGFREGSLPVIVYATDNYMRDPDNGYATPPAANNTAGESDVRAAVDNIGARLVGIGTQSSLPVPQMEQLAYATGSLYAKDSDGIADDPLVLTWTGSSAAFRDTVVSAIEGLLVSVTFSTVTAEVTGNTWGLETEVSPESYTDVTVGGSAVDLVFTVTVTGEVPASDEERTFPMTLTIYGDETTLIGTEDFTVVVPASL